MSFPYRSALIVGAGPGISASLARVLRGAGVSVGVAARRIENVRALAAEVGAHPFSADATRSESVVTLFKEATETLGEIDIVVYNAGTRVRGALEELVPAEVEKVIASTAFGGFLVAQQAARGMIPRGRGALFFTGASASVKGYANSAAFAMGKFALRGLAQSAARELGPKGIHVAHFIIDGGVSSATRKSSSDQPDTMLDPDAIAQTYLDVMRQPRSAWSHEIDLRPWVERF